MKHTLPVLLLLAAPAAAQKVTVPAAPHDRTNVVVSVPLPRGLAAPNVVALAGGGQAPAQVTGPALGDDPRTGKRLVFVLPRVKANEAVEATPEGVTYVAAPPQFRFVEQPGQPTELVFGARDKVRPVLQYFNLPRDANDHYYTFKPFHNVYDPADGKVMLTNTSAKTAKDGQFPHHRGLFFGFNKVTYGDKKTADIWHGTNNVYSQHDKTLAQEEGVVFGRHTSQVSWHGPDGATFATEARTVAAYATHGGTLIDWSTELTTTLPKVRLDGDPQHAGFHFRAAQEVAKNGKQNTYYLRPDGKGKVGETRNWDAKTKDAKAVNLPWNAVSFVVGGKRYTTVRLNHPDNPGETRGSERDYGRFGDYFEYDLTPEKPLRLKYRVWVQEGEMTVEQCAALSRAFVSK